MHTLNPPGCFWRIRMPKDTILVIEDEKNIVEFMKCNLEQEGFAVITEGRGALGLERARNRQYSNHHV